MSMREREGLIRRIRQMRGRPLPDQTPPPAPPAGPAAATADPAVAAADSDAAAIEALRARVAHLEQLVQGLQDSVHRESERQGKLISEIQAQIQPGPMNAALSKDARDRGL
jgi:hypothetical protein